MNVGSEITSTPESNAPETEVEELNTPIMSRLSSANESPLLYSPNCSNTRQSPGTTDTERVSRSIRVAENAESWFVFRYVPRGFTENTSAMPELERQKKATRLHSIIFFITPWNKTPVIRSIEEGAGQLKRVMKEEMRPSLASSAAHWVRSLPGFRSINSIIS